MICSTARSLSLASTSTVRRWPSQLAGTSAGSTNAACGRGFGAPHPSRGDERCMYGSRPRQVAAAVVHVVHERDPRTVAEGEEVADREQAVVVLHGQAPARPVAEPVEP